MVYIIYELIVNKVKFSIEEHIMRVKFITDSMAGLDRRYIDKHGIAVLSRKIEIGDDIFTEADMNYPMFYKSISNSHDNMTAKDITEDEFFIAFQKYTVIGQKIVCTLPSQKISQAYTNAKKRKRKSPAAAQGSGNHHNRFSL